MNVSEVTTPTSRTIPAEPKKIGDIAMEVLEPLLKQHGHTALIALNTYLLGFIYGIKKNY